MRPSFRHSSRLLITLGVVAFELIVVAFFLFRQLVAPPPPAQAARIAGESTIVGVHTRLADEVEPWKIARTTDLAAQMGAGWMVELFPWAYIEPQEGVFDWVHPDLVVESAHRSGLTIVARLDLVPTWARPKDSTPRLLEESRYDDYGEFVYQFARRYQGSIGYIIIANEPNTSFEWGYRPVDPESYVRLLAVAYRRAKEANPAVQVLPAGLAPTLERSALALDDLEYLRRMYAAGAKSHFDLMNIHAYGWRLPPDDPPAADRLNFARAALYREIMLEYGDGDKGAIITEAGWNDHPRWSKSVRPAQRIDYTIRSYEKTAQEWPWVRALCLWVFRLPAPANNYNDYFTFVGVDFTPRAVYEAVREASESGRFRRVSP